MPCRAAHFARCLQETSEEVRLQLINLALCMLRQPGPGMHAKLDDLTAVACAALADPSPDIKRVRPSHWAAGLVLLWPGQSLSAGPLMGKPLLSLCLQGSSSPATPALHRQTLVQAGCSAVEHLVSALQPQGLVIC